MQFEQTAQTKNQKMNKLLFGIASLCGLGVFAGTFKTITINGNTSDWAGIAPAYSDEDGVNNPTGVDFQNVYLANDTNYLYIRFTLKQSADPITAGNTYLWFDNDNNSATGFNPFGNLNFGASLMLIGNQAYQEAGGGFNEGTLTNANAAYGAASLPGTNFEFRIARKVTGVAGAFAGVPLLNNPTIGVQLGTDTGTADSLPAWANYGVLHYNFSAPLGLMVPAYFSPSTGGYWNALNFAATRVPLIAIMNPNSGPGTSQSSAYVQALASLHQAGGQVIGYVHTTYGARSLSTVEAEVATYISFYNIDGFFIDEMANDQNVTNIAYYASLYDYIKSQNTNYIVTGNPGSNTQESYVTEPTADNFLIFEDNGTNYGNFTPAAWVSNYPARKFVHVPYAVTSATTMSNDVATALSRNAGWIYITDDTLSNPYDTLPSYWTNEVNYVRSLNGGIK